MEKLGALKNDMYGLVACGGKSSRMGTDKSRLYYHDIPQCYHVYKMFQPFCEKVLLSCNPSQQNDFLPGYEIMVDGPSYSNIGPIAALLTAFEKFPGKSLLLFGCDYPFLTEKELADFLASLQHKDMPATFYNTSAAMYEPLLGYYPFRIANDLFEMYLARKHSLQYFLKEHNAVKFYPSKTESIKSIDTLEDFNNVKAILKSRNCG